MTNPSVSSYVTIRDRCPMRYRVVDNEIVEFAFGGIRDPFEFLFDIHSLRDFMELATLALQEMDERGKTPTD